MAKDKWDKVEIIAGIVGGILVPMAIFYAGLFISQAEKESSSLSSQAEHLTSLIEHLSSTNPKQQLIAVEVANYLAKKKQLPDELVPTLVRIVKQTENAETALIATQAVLTAAKSNSVTEQAVKQEFSDITPRVYFQIPREELRAYVKNKEVALENSLSSIGLTVPGIELKAKASPDETQLRYFKSDGKEEALSIQSALKTAGVDAKLVDLSARYENSKDIRPRHYELWIGKNIQQ